jgi:Flp pilus assembly pilin Flp
MGRLFRDESGQGTVEYILILSVSVLAASQIAKRILGAFDQVVLVIGAQLERDLKTGRIGPSAWQN